MIIMSWVRIPLRVKYNINRQRSYHQRAHRWHLRRSLRVVIDVLIFQHLVEPFWFTVQPELAALERWSPSTSWWRRSTADLSRDKFIKTFYHYQRTRWLVIDFDEWIEALDKFAHDNSSLCNKLVKCLK